MPFTATLLLLAVLSSSTPNEPVRTGAFDGLDSVIAGELAHLKVPGCALAVVAGGHIVYARGFGVTSAENRIPVTAEALFRVGSMTKMVTALTAISVAREHGIKLDEPVGPYVKGISPAVGRVTLEQLLTHTAGFKDEIVATPLVSHTDESALMTEVLSWDGSIFFTEPGDIHSYSNLGYVLVGAFIEQVSGKRYADTVSERVLKPLGITDATFRPEMAVTYPFSQGHVGRPGDEPRVVRPIVTDTRHWPAGFLWASAADYARIMIALMNRGAIDGRQALDADVVDAVVRQRVAVVEPPSTYGFGVGGARGIRGTLGHGGRMEGYAARLLMAPDRNAGVVLLSNRFDVGLPKSFDEAIRRAGMIAGGESERDDPMKTTAAAVADAQAYAGVYANGSHTIAIEAAAGELTLKNGAQSGSLSLIAPDRFRLAWSNSESGRRGTSNVMFVRGKDGAVKYLAMGERAYRRPR